MKAISRRFNTRKPGAVGRFKRFAVLMPLVEAGGRLNFLFEERARDLDRQPGEVCFPGGEQEDGETPLMCAVRETMEELGVRRKAIEVIIKADTVYGSRSSLVSCYLASLDTGGMQPSAAEVEEVFLVPVSFFMESEPVMGHMTYVPRDVDDFPNEMIRFPQGYNWMDIEHEVPIYEYGDHVIWGLTGRMIQNFVSIMKGEKK